MRSCKESDKVPQKKKNYEVQEELTISTPVAKPILEKVIIEKIVEPVEKEIQRIPPLFPQRILKSKEDAFFKKSFDTFRELHINLPLLDVLQEMTKYKK